MDMVSYTENNTRYILLEEPHATNNTDRIQFTARAAGDDGLKHQLFWKKDPYYGTVGNDAQIDGPNSNPRIIYDAPDEIILLFNPDPGV